MIRISTTALAMAAMVMVPTQALAQAGSSETQSGQQQAKIAFAQERGTLMYWYDQAAWHASDALVEALAKEKDVALEGNPVGFLVVPGDSDSFLDTYFITEIDGAFHYFARYTTAGSTVVDGGLHLDAPPPVPPLALRMLEARQAGIEALAAGEVNICTDQRPNTLVTPPDADGTISVYLLTPQTDTRSYPMGGHSRADVAADGAVSIREYTRSCLELGVGDEDQIPVAIGTMSLMDAVPTDVHVFVAHYLPAPMTLMTTDRSVYMIQNGRISSMDDDAD